MSIHSEKIKIEHDSNAFIQFKGTEVSDASKNLSTMQGGGSLQAPKDTNGWVFQGMIKIEIKDSNGNIVERWIPHYTTG